nr:virulence RhuM family protein [Desulfobulbaceae bacterium]
MSYLRISCTAECRGRSAPRHPPAQIDEQGGAGGVMTYDADIYNRRFPVGAGPRTCPDGDGQPHGVAPTAGIEGESMTNSDLPGKVQNFVIFKTADAKATQTFFKLVQSKLHYAVHRHTAAELIVARADAENKNMGLTTWDGSPDKKLNGRTAVN